MLALPKITVVTPSYNQAQFIRETIESVLSQEYPQLEYIVIDGASKDGSFDIIETYRSSLAYAVSERDAGQAEAINKGFRVSTGDLLCWVNSDDLLMPGALQRIGRAYQNGGQQFIYGDGVLFKDSFKFHKRRVRPGLVTSQELAYHDPIQQPSAFWTRHVFNTIGEIDERFHYVLDWDYFLRVSQSFEMHYLPHPLSAYRIHAAHKSGSGNPKRSAEIMQMVHRHALPPWPELYHDLLPLTEEIARLRARWHRFYFIPFSIKFPELCRKYGSERLKIATRVV